MVRTGTEQATAQTSGRDRDARQRAILDAAQDLISTEGLEGLRIREVAQRAGMHHASLLHYYGTREALVQGVVARIVAQLDRVPAPAHPGETPSSAAALHAYFGHVLAQMQAHPEQFIVLNELFGRAKRDAAIRAVLVATEASWQGYLVPLLEAGVGDGSFRADLDPPTVASIITNCLTGLSLQLTGDRDQAARVVAQLERWICAG